MDKIDVAVIMGSQSDWQVMKHATDILQMLQIAHHAKIVSAHRTPERMVEFAKNAQTNGIKVIIAGAGGAAHLPGMVASLTPLPVLGVPISGEYLSGVDALHSIVQMPSGIPVGTLAIGKAGAKNAALLAVRILALSDEAIAIRLQKWQDVQTQSVKSDVVKD